MIDLKIKIARFKLEKLGVMNDNLWIMLIKPTTRKPYFCLNILIFKLKRFIIEQ